MNAFHYQRRGVVERLSTAPRATGRLAMALGLTLLSACGGEDSTSVATGGGSGGEGSGSSGAAGLGGGNSVAGSAGTAGADAAPVYALITQVFGADGADSQSYVVLTETLDASADVDLADAVELSGRAIGGALPGGEALFVGGDSGPTVTRYDLADGPALERGATVSFVGQGLSGLGEYGGQFHFVSETKAYFFDGATAQVIVWNPEAMTVTGGELLPDLVLEGALLTFSASPIVAGDSVLTFAGWRAGPLVPNRAGIVRVNTVTDEVTVAIDDRCGYARDGAMGSDGLVYVATEAYGSAVHRLNPDNTNAPCLLRYDPVSGEFDPDFYVALDTLVGGQSAGSLTRGAGDSVFLRVLDESAFPIMDDTPPRLLASVPAWRWAELSLGDEPTARMLDTGPAGGSVVVLDLGDEMQAALFSGRDATTLSPLGPGGLGAPGLSVSGLVFAAATLR